MKRRPRVRLACLVVLMVTAVEARAGFTTFNNRADFDNAAGSLQTFDFNTELGGDFDPPRDFGSFTIMNTDPTRLIAGVSSINAESVDGSTHIFFESMYTQSPLRLTFDSPLSAFGFDWRAVDVTDDGFDLVVNGELLVVSAGAPANGFFGILSTTGSTFKTIDLQDDRDGGGYNDGVGFDNLSFTSQVSPVPEPSSLAVFGIGACGAGIGAARRRRRAA